MKLMIAIVIINTWNRFAITFRDEPGSLTTQRVRPWTVLLDSRKKRSHLWEEK